MLFSRMVDLPRVRKNATASTAIGIEADTVRPILSAKYTLDAAKTMPRMAPRATARRVSSAGDWLGSTNGLNPEVWGLIAVAMRSGWEEVVRILRPAAAGRKARHRWRHPL